MSTSLVHLALFVAKDCDPDQGRRVVFWSIVAIAVLFAQFGWLALAAVGGSFFGLAIREMALRGARAVCKAVNEISARCLLGWVESRAIAMALSASAARNFRCLEQKAFRATVAIFAGLGVAHVVLSVRLFPYPVLNRA